MSLEFVVCVCGGRDFTNAYEIYKFLDKVHSNRKIDTLIHGDARGADKISGAWAKSRNINVIPVPANWEKYKSLAGPKRNKVMVDMKPNLVIAFPGGRGTANMVEQSKKSGIKVYEFKLSYLKKEINNGNILDSKCDYIVNTVNSVGVMGAGLAKSFIENKKFTKKCKIYNELVSKNRKEMLSDTIPNLLNPILFNKDVDNIPGILFFPTKIHWKNSSKLEYIEHSLKFTMNAIKSGEWEINSIAFPKVGCGLGGLDWTQVSPLFDKYLSDYKGYVEIYK